MEGYITLAAPEFILICNIMAEWRAKRLDPFALGYSDWFSPPWYYGDDGNLYLQEV